MVTLNTLRQEKRAEILRLAETHGARNVRVFGSVARAENREDSDVDATWLGESLVECRRVRGEVIGVKHVNCAVGASGLAQFRHGRVQPHRITAHECHAHRALSGEAAGDGDADFRASSDQENPAQRLRHGRDPPGWSILV